MKTPISVAITIIILMLSQSCRPLYVPNAQNVPILKEKNDISVNIGFNDLQGAVAVSNNIGIMLNGYTNNIDLGFDWDDDEKTNRSFIEAGAGYFTQLSGSSVFEIYGGAGLGSFSLEKSDSGGAYSANNSRFFIQPGISFSSNAIDLVISCRFVKYGINDPDLSRYNTQGFFSKDISDAHNNSYYFAEPALTLKAGWRQVKAFMQLQVPKQLNSPMIDVDGAISLGVYLNCGERFKTEALSN